MTKQIPLTQGKFALVDDEDFEHLNQFKWCVNNWNYAIRAIPVGNKKQKAIMMHRTIINAVNGGEVDHIDGNGLNNQKSNLRICSRSQNGKNRLKNKSGSSKYKGVSFNKRCKKWGAYIRVDYKLKFLGYFFIEWEAADAYNSAAIKYHGEFARLNYRTI